MRSGVWTGRMTEGVESFMVKIRPPTSTVFETSQGIERKEDSGQVV